MSLAVAAAMPMEGLSSSLDALWAACIPVGGVEDGRRSLESAHTGDLEEYDRPWLRRRPQSGKKFASSKILIACLQRTPSCSGAAPHPHPTDKNLFN